ATRSIIALRPARKSSFRSACPCEAEMIAAFAPGTIANANHCLKIRPPRRLGDQADIAAAVADFEVETFERAVRKRLIAFRAIVANVTAGDGPRVDQIAANGHLGFAIYLQPDVALPLPERNIITTHSAGSELGVRPCGRGHAKRSEHQRRTAHCFN